MPSFPERAAPDHLLEARGVGFSVPRRCILADLHLSAGKGECIGLIGPNGSGKTTLMKVLLGRLAPSAGVIRLGARSIEKIPPRERARLMAYMSQDVPAVFPFTVREVLWMGRYPYHGFFGRPTVEEEALMTDTLRQVGLDGWEDRIFSDMSGGERQLVLFARALVQGSPLMMLDEPASHLDLAHEDLIFRTARRLTREGRTVIASAHRLDVAARYCSRLWLLDRGRLAADGAPAEVLRPERLDPVYGVATAVGAHPVSGALTVTVLPRPD